MQSEASDTYKELKLYLESRSVSLECGLPSGAGEKRTLLIAQNSDERGLAVLSQLLGGKTEISGNRVQSETGYVSVIAGNVEAEIKTLPSGEECSLESVAELLKSIGINADIIYTGSSAVLSGSYGEKNEPVFNAVLTVAQEGDAFVIFGNWYFGEPVPAGEDTEHGAAGLIVSFADGLISKDAEFSKIISIEKGYLTQTITNVGAKLIPVYRIETDGGAYYINALDAAVLEL